MLPKNIEEQFELMAYNKNINRNWLEYQALKAGVDFDHIRGYDDGEPPELLNNEE